MAAGMASAVVALAGDERRVTAMAAAGLARRRPARAATPETAFDLGSLTKPFVATLALRLDATGRLPLALPVGEVWPRADRRLARRRLATLLRHRAGFIAWAPLYALAGAPVQAVDLLLAGDLLGAPAGTYSDLDSILWGLTAERRCGEPLAALLAREVLAPLGAAGVVAAPAPDADLAESRLDNRREVDLAARLGIEIAPERRLLRGVAQDGNLRFLCRRGAIAGHAGLFGTAADLWRLGREWLAPGALLTPGQVERALSGSGPFALGWARRRVRGTAGAALPPTAFGHAGFPGGSLWIDPERRRILVLLAQRLDSRSDMNAWRRRFHALMAPPG